MMMGFYYGAGCTHLAKPVCQDTRLDLLEGEALGHQDTLCSGCRLTASLQFLLTHAAGFHVQELQWPSTAPAALQPTAPDPAVCMLGSGL